MIGHIKDIDWASEAEYSVHAFRLKWQQSSIIIIVNFLICPYRINVSSLY